MDQPRQKTGGRQAKSSGSGRKNIVGVRLRQARLNAQPKLNQADVAARLGDIGVQLDTNAVSKIERGEREVLDFELKAMGEALNVPVKWLLDEKDTV